METLINQLASNPNRPTPRNGDYMANYHESGKQCLVCGYCHEFRECYPFWNSQKFPQLRDKRITCKCPCENAEYNAWENSVRAKWAEQEQKSEIAKKHKRRACFGKNSQMLEWTFENDDQKNLAVSQRAHRYATNFEQHHKNGKGIMFYGSIGTGKTYMAAAIANAVIEQGYSVRFTSLPKLVNEITETWQGRNRRTDTLAEPDLLIIDDVGAERDSQYMNEQVLQIIDTRYQSGKPLIVTTNLDLKDISDAENTPRARILSRIRGMCQPVQVAGADRRV